MTACRKLNTKLKIGDPVMVIAGGNSHKSGKFKGQRGAIRKFLSSSERVVVEGVNMIKRHKRGQQMGENSEILDIEGSIHISNVMFCPESLDRPVKLCFHTLGDGRKVRGYKDPKTGEFEQVDM